MDRESYEVNKKVTEVNRRHDKFGIYLGNLPSFITETEVEDLLSSFDDVRLLRLLKKEKKVFCFLNCPNQDSVIHVVRALDQKYVKGRKLCARALNEQLQQQCLSGQQEINMRKKLNDTTKLLSDATLKNSSGSKNIWVNLPICSSGTSDDLCLLSEEEKCYKELSGDIPPPLGIPYLSEGVNCRSDGPLPHQLQKSTPCFNEVKMASVNTGSVLNTEQKPVYSGPPKNGRFCQSHGAESFFNCDGKSTDGTSKYVRGIEKDSRNSGPCKISNSHYPKSFLSNYRHSLENMRGNSESASSLEQDFVSSQCERLNRPHSYSNCHDHTVVNIPNSTEVKKHYSEVCEQTQVSNPHYHVSTDTHFCSSNNAKHFGGSLKSVQDVQTKANQKYSKEFDSVYCIKNDNSHKDSSHVHSGPDTSINDDFSANTLIPESNADKLSHGKSCPLTSQYNSDEVGSSHVSNKGECPPTIIEQCEQSVLQFPSKENMSDKYVHSAEMLLVSNFPFYTSEEDIYELFEDFQPLGVWIMSNMYSYGQCTEAYVAVPNEQLALDAIMHLDNTEYKRRTLLVTDVKETDILSELLFLHGQLDETSQDDVICHP